MPSTTAVIQIIGIFLMSYQIVPGSLVAVAPRISCPTEKEVKADTAAFAMSSTGIEAHEALLVFPQRQYKSNEDWAPKAYPGRPGQLYVKLDGEKIRFITGVVTRDTPDGPADLRLPHVYGECCKDAELRPEYMPPDYSGAAAVLDLSNGRIDTCTVGTRADTVVNIANKGSLTVEGTKGNRTKRITFSGDVYLVFANVPVDATEPKAACHSKTPHYKAYGAMARACNKSVPCTTGKGDPVACEQSPMYRMALDPK